MSKYQYALPNDFERGLLHECKGSYFEEIVFHRMDLRILENCLDATLGQEYIPQYELNLESRNLGTLKRLDASSTMAILICFCQQKR